MHKLYTDELVKGEWYCNGNALPHNWNLLVFYVAIFIQCNVFMNFQSIVIRL